ncbi:MAG: ABC transporter ATP-binding protein/permease [Paraglaciecola sp.]|uniref:ABC transporter ATP-binding protein n=1 Tax=Paraglaciecola sp. TaxID=1920173 RepID=UPI00273FF922|nr:ABC transporter ATP-binding protein [Paraglaciecola sp.]MDP5030749.1 ABC transporter ATP-binding protein/permease [Paraglaciecola sp.]MDP5132301.1 ABC transporter ATP-binding protein/permease [Paraglaciecola sp.]
MLSTVRKLIALLNGEEKKKVTWLALLMTITAIIQTIGIASVMPFLAVISDQQLIYDNNFLNKIFVALKFHNEKAFLYFLGILAFLIFTFGTILQATTFWLTSRFAQLQQYQLSRRLMADYLRRPYSFFLTRNSSELAKTVLQETGHAVIGALLPAMRLVGSFMLAIIIIAMLIVIHPILAISVALAVGLSYTTVFLFSKRWLKRIGEDRDLANRQRFSASAEAFAGAKEIRLLGRENEYLERYRDPSQRFALHQANSGVLANLPLYVIEAIAFGGIILVSLALMTDDKGLANALPLIGVYALAGKQLIPAINKIFAAIAELQFNIPSVNNILNDLGDREGSRPLPDKSITKIPLTPKKEIQVNNLIFTYAGAETPALKGINLKISAQTTVGLVGSSGAGKSTFIDLLLGLLEPEKGNITIDNQLLDHKSIPNWQATIGYVPQHIFLADQSIAANIALGVPASDIDQQAVIKAAKQANLDEFIVNNLPDGYNTIIGERGVRLSGGQRQRIGIARALYRNPSVLVFDEATSALDNATELSVMEAINNLAGQKTIFIVAHRLSTVKNCDTICVFSAGNIVECGSWQDLTRNGSHFKKLSAGIA